MMIKWKKVLAAGLGTAMLFSQTAYADTVMGSSASFYWRQSDRKYRTWKWHSTAGSDRRSE